MPDISMCANEECPLKKHCYRATATPSQYMQSYGMFEYDAKEGCKYYWEDTNITIYKSKVGKVLYNEVKLPKTKKRAKK